jgi:hypothetical protein
MRKGRKVFSYISLYALYGLKRKVEIDVEVEKVEIV